MSFIRLLSHRLPLPLSRLPRSFPSITRTSTCSCIRTFATTSKSTSTSIDDKKTSNPTSTSKDDDDDDIDEIDEDDVDEDEDIIIEPSTSDPSSKMDEIDDDVDDDVYDDDDMDMKRNTDRDIHAYDIDHDDEDDIIITPSKKDTKKYTKKEISSRKNKNDDDVDASIKNDNDDDIDEDEEDFENEYDALELNSHKITVPYKLPKYMQIRPSRPGYVFIRTMIAEELQEIEIKESDLDNEKTLERAIDEKELEILEKEFPDNDKDYDEEIRIEAEKKEITMDEEMPMLRMEQARLSALIVQEELQDSPNDEVLGDLTHRLEFIQSRILLWEGGYFEDPTEDEINEVKEDMRTEAEEKIAAAREAQAAAIQKYSQNIKPEVIKKLAAEHPEAYPLAAALANNEIIQWYTDKEEKHMIRNRPRTKKSTTYEPVKEDLPAITTFLTSIKQEKHIDKFPSWWALMSMKSLRMKKANIGCQDRKKILKAVENHKRSRYREYLAQHINEQISQQKQEYNAYAAARKQEYDIQRTQTKNIRQSQIDAQKQQKPLPEEIQNKIDAQAAQVQKELDAQMHELYLRRYPSKRENTTSTSTTPIEPIVPKTQSRDRSYEKTW